MLEFIVDSDRLYLFRQIKVRKGQYAVFGAELGTAGLDSISQKYQITFMVFQNGQPIDPAKAPRN